MRDGVGPHGQLPQATPSSLAASADGKRSVTVSVNDNTPRVRQPGVFDALRRAEVKAVCAALAD